MSNLNDELEQIRTRAARFTELQQGSGDFTALDAAAYQSQSDVPRLLALVQELDACEPLGRMGGYENEAL